MRSTGVGIQKQMVLLAINQGITGVSVEHLQVWDYFFLYAPRIPCSKPKLHSNTSTAAHVTTSAEHVCEEGRCAEWDLFHGGTHG